LDALGRGVVTSAQPDSEHKSVVGCGRPIEGVRVEIVHPTTRLPCEPNEVGEIWVQGSVVAGGYLNTPHESEQTFGATRADAPDGGAFLRTGDLGFLHEGVLFIAGRIRDLIIIRGRKIHPQDVESTLERVHPAICQAGVAAFSVDDGSGERLVVLVEVSGGPGLSIQAISGAVREALVDRYQLRASVIVLLEPGGVAKTDSGKIRRGACREAYLAGRLVRFDGSPVRPMGSLRPPAENPSQHSVEDITEWLVGNLASLSKVDKLEIDVGQPFNVYGVDSLRAVRLSADLGAWLGRTLSPTLLWEYPTIDELAQELGQTRGGGVS
jgi:acyl carrier protein